MEKGEKDSQTNNDQEDATNDNRKLCLSNIPKYLGKTQLAEEVTKCGIKFQY